MQARRAAYGQACQAPARAKRYRRSGRGGQDEGQDELRRRCAALRRSIAARGGLGAVRRRRRAAGYRLSAAMRGMQMTPRSLPFGGGRLKVVTLAFLLATNGASCAGSRTYQHGESTTVIQQSGGEARSRSQVTRYSNGQTVVTQDGVSTDISIQGQAGRAADEARLSEPDHRVGSFNPSPREEMARSRWPGVGAEPSEPRSSRMSAQETFKQHMLDRMRAPSPARWPE